MAADTLAIADRLERSGLPPAHARAVAAEFAGLRDEVVTREYLDLALAKLRAETERDIAALGAKTERDIAGLRLETERLRLDMERLLREQTNKLVVWLCAIVGVAVTIVGGLGVLF